MAKPPRKIPASTSADTSLPPPRPDTPADTRAGTGLSIADTAGGSPTPGSSSAMIVSDVPGQRPSVIVNALPDPLPHSLAQPTQAAPGAADSTPPHAGAVEGAGNINIAPELAALLMNTPHTPEGFRHDKRGASYINMEDGSLWLVRRQPEGHYRQASAHDRNWLGAEVELIPTSKLWRRVEPTSTTAKRPQADPELPPAETAGPSKRPRHEQADTARADALMESLISRQPNVLDLSAGQWKNWGKTSKPEQGDSIEIDGAHFSIVSTGGQPHTGLVYVQHPRFSPEGYDGFEHVLINEPSHQPKWAIQRDGQWHVVENHLPFEMPMAQYVSSAFKYLSEHTERALARGVFDHSRQSKALDNHALSMMVLTFRHWHDRINNEAPTTRGLLDPLMLLPRLSAQPDPLYPGGLLSLPPSNAHRFQRIDFDPQKFPGEWAEYAAAPTPANLRNVFGTLLRNNGYTLHPSSRALQEGALIFHREGVAAVFVLKLPRITGHSIPRPTLPGSEISGSAFQARLTPAAQRELNIHLAQKQVIYLVGGVQPTGPGKKSFFIVREG